ncbi:MAG: hypothetical protein ACRESO_06370, partial [Gammaproteobacteria bacterium]
AWVSQVRANGIPFNAQTLKIISQRATRSDLIAALPSIKSMDGNVYFTGVTPALFTAIVRATKDGTPVALSQASQVNTKTPASAARISAALVTEKKQ